MVARFLILWEEILMIAIGDFVKIRKDVPDVGMYSGNGGKVIDIIDGVCFVETHDSLGKTQLIRCHESFLEVVPIEIPFTKIGEKFNDEQYNDFSLIAEEIQSNTKAPSTPPPLHADDDMPVTLLKKELVMLIASGYTDGFRQGYIIAFNEFQDKLIESGLLPANKRVDIEKQFPPIPPTEL